jgi:hypothetical protein
MSRERAAWSGVGEVLWAGDCQINHLTKQLRTADSPNHLGNCSHRSGEAKIESAYLDPQSFVAGDDIIDPSALRHDPLQVGIAT